MEQKRYHIVITSVLFAILAWLTVTLREEYVMVRHVPIVIENMKEGKALKYEIPKTISMHFKSSGWMLAGLYLIPDLAYYIDMSTTGDDDFVLTRKDILEHIKIPFSLQPFDIKPESLNVGIDDYKERRVPIVPNLMIGLKDGYGQVGPVRITPDSITIGGSKEIIASITSWRSAYKKFEGLYAPVSMDLGLEDPGNYSVMLMPTEVKLAIDVQPFAEKTFSGIPLVAIAVPANREVIFIPPRFDIVVRGGIQQLAKLTPDDFRATVSYQYLIEDSAQVVVPQITVPQKTKIIGQTPVQFKFIIRKKL
jgi:YbbR domain-containing protein